MANVVHAFVEGVPAKKKKARGDKQTPARWKVAVQAQTAGLAKMDGPCQLDIEFILLGISFPSDHPYGPDLDNLLKSTLDALNETVLSSVKGKDGAIVDLRARKRKAREGEPTGARIIFAGTVLPGEGQGALR